VHVGALTVHTPSFQTSLSNDLSNGSSPFCASHNASNTGSSKLLQQRASATAVAWAFEEMSSHTINLMISSTLRHGCIESRGYFLLLTCASKVRGTLTTHDQGRSFQSVVVYPNCRCESWISDVLFHHGQLTRAVIPQTAAIRPSKLCTTLTCRLISMLLLRVALSIT
jgi:hypothetical protein